MVKHWWPEPLRNMKFGPSFNDSVSSIVWPTSLERLVFGASYDQPIHGFEWPLSLRHLEFGERLNQVIPRGTLLMSEGDELC